MANILVRSFIVSLAFVLVKVEQASSQSPIQVFLGDAHIEKLLFDEISYEIKPGEFKYVREFKRNSDITFIERNEKHYLLFEQKFSNGEVSGFSLIDLGKDDRALTGLTFYKNERQKAEAKYAEIELKMMKFSRERRSLYNANKSDEDPQVKLINSKMDDLQKESHEVAVPTLNYREDLNALVVRSEGKEVPLVYAFTIALDVKKVPAKAFRRSVTQKEDELISAGELDFTLREAPAAVHEEDIEKKIFENIDKKSAPGCP
ncbi:MAG: hypothetical protein J0L93_01955 [Deltaproteobacteria bacterium]|nr:hypothetical protein [Deltaproteobacteria bacterium]